jgi:hypothetical protein
MAPILVPQLGQEDQGAAVLAEKQPMDPPQQ